MLDITSIYGHIQTVYRSLQRARRRVFQARRLLPVFECFLCSGHTGRLKLLPLSVPSNIYITSPTANVLTIRR